MCDSKTCFLYEKFQTDFKSNIEELSVIKREINFIKSRFNSFNVYLEKEGSCDKAVIHELESISNDYSTRICRYIQQNEDMLDKINNYFKCEKAGNKSSNPAKLPVKANEPQIFQAATTTSTSTTPSNQPQIAPRERLELKTHVPKLTTIRQSNSTEPAETPSLSQVKNIPSKLLGPAVASVITPTASIPPTETNNTDEADDERSYEKLRLKEYLNQYNYNLVKDNYENILSYALNTKHIIKKFREYLNSLHLKPKYLALNLFHVPSRRLNGLLLRMPSWDGCKYDTKIIFYLIDKFLNNKEEVMKNLNVYLKEYRFIRLPKSQMFKKEPVEHDNDAVTNEVVNNEIDNNDATEVASACSSDKNMKSNQIRIRPFWLQLIREKIKDLVIFLNKNSIDTQLFASNVLNCTSETLNVFISSVNNEEFDYSSYGSFWSNITFFLNDEASQRRLINLNKKIKPIFGDHDYANPVNPIVESPESTKTPQTGYYADADYIANEENNSDSDDSDVDYSTKWRPIKEEEKCELDTNVDQDKCSYRRSLRSRRKAEVESNYSRYPYDISNVFIEDKISPKEISDQLKIMLEKENISKPDFSQSITRSSHTTIYDLLNKPKPWDELSELSKMRLKLVYLWLKDEDRMSKIQRSITNEIKLQKQLHNNYLCEKFNFNPYPTNYELEEMSNYIGLSKRDIKSWFSSRRQLLKSKVQLEAQTQQSTSTSMRNINLNSSQNEALTEFFNENISSLNPFEMKQKVKILSEKLNLSIELINDWLRLKSESVKDLNRSRQITDYEDLFESDIDENQPNETLCLFEQTIDNDVLSDCEFNKTENPTNKKNECASGQASESVLVEVKENGGNNHNDEEDEDKSQGIEIDSDKNESNEGSNDGSDSCNKNINGFNEVVPDQVDDHKLSSNDKNKYCETSDETEQSKDDEDYLDTKKYSKENVDEVKLVEDDVNNNEVKAKVNENFDTNLDDTIELVENDDNTNDDNK